MTLRRAFTTVFIATAALLMSCEAVCGCFDPPPTEVVYGRVESAAGGGISTAVVLYQLAIDTACVFDDLTERGEIDVVGQGRFHAQIYGEFEPQVQCLELRAFDPATGEADTTSILIFVDFANPDSTGVVLRLP